MTWGKIHQDNIGDLQIMMERIALGCGIHSIINENSIMIRKKHRF